MGNRLGAVCVLLFGVCAAWGQEHFVVRLTTVPMELSMRAEVTGRGSASGILAGARLSITGSFEGLRAPATTAQVHEGPVKGVRGPVIGDLTVSRSTHGDISGSFDLTAEQQESLRKGRLYIQIHSEKAPDGNLWGWLLK